MHACVVKEFKADQNNDVIIELGFIPSYAMVKNLVSGKQLEYVNTTIGLSSLAIAAATVENDITDGEYIAADGTLAADSKLTRTAVGTVGVPNTTAAGLIVAPGVADISDADGEQCVVIAFRSDV